MNPDEFGNMLTGDNGINVIDGLGGNDTISGVGGNDILSGSEGEDQINGDAGDDLIDGGDDNDTLIGGTGNDIILGGEANDLISGGDGNDNLSGDDGVDTLNGGAGIDVIDGKLGSDFGNGGFGQDFFTDREIQPDSYDGGNGFDIYFFDIEPADIVGLAPSLRFDLNANSAGLTGNQATRDSLQNIEGMLYTGEVDTRVTGDAGANYIYTGNGTNLIDGGDGNDNLWGGNGTNTIDAGPGHDLVSGRGGTGELTLGAGMDTVLWDGRAGANQVIVDFAADDLLVVRLPTLEARDITNGVISAVASNASPPTLTINGPSAGTAFSVANGAVFSYVQVEAAAPTLAEGQALAESAVNGGQHRGFFGADLGFLEEVPDQKLIQYNFQLDATAQAGFSNTLGLLRYDALGRIVEAEILFANTNEDPTASGSVRVSADTGIALQNVAAMPVGIAFFIVQDGASWANGLSGTDELGFIDADDEIANIFDDEPLMLAVNGVEAQQTVFHSHLPGMNADGVNHAVSWFEGDTLVMGFEDQTGGGDRDFQDVLVQVTQSEINLM